MQVNLHRILLALIVIGNLVAFAGVDPIARVTTAVLAVILALDLRKMPPTPRIHRVTAYAVSGLILLQLVPLPPSLRGLLQPGFSDVMAAGWGPLSLAPWATLQFASGLIVAVVLALVSARMAATRSGLPTLLIVIAVAGIVTAILGLVAEDSDPTRVLFIRDNIQGGSAYGSFVNRNHFAQAMELTIPAGLVLLVAASRRLRVPGIARQRAATSMLLATVAVVVSITALIRSGSRGGVFFAVVAAVITLPWWRRYKRSGRLWPKLVVVVLVGVLIGAMTWNRLPDLKERTMELIAVEGLQGNSRIDLWRSTAASWMRAPLFGSGLGTYRYVISMDKPATGAMVLEQAHNDWLEVAATGGAVGAVILMAAVLGLALLLKLSSIRKMRSDLRYPFAAVAFALVATSLHEVIGFGLQTPAVRYLAFVWLGLAWGLWERANRHRSERQAVVADRPSPPSNTEDAS
ncbi:MAG: O-antigen ligase family protein [Thermoanaerobaculales bacterium]|nr:O-antigen ligase family protein [Thermoanaerobaculales bacterium]